METLKIEILNHLTNVITSDWFIPSVGIAFILLISQLLYMVNSASKKTATATINEAIKILLDTKQDVINMLEVCRNEFKAQKLLFTTMQDISNQTNNRAIAKINEHEQVIKNTQVKLTELEQSSKKLNDSIQTNVHLANKDAEYTLYKVHNELKNKGDSLLKSEQTRMQLIVDENIKLISHSVNSRISVETIINRFVEEAKTKIDIAVKKNLTKPEPTYGFEFKRDNPKSVGIITDSEGYRDEYWEFDSNNYAYSNRMEEFQSRARYKLLEKYQQYRKSKLT